jgi:hypothetical protein
VKNVLSFSKYDPNKEYKRETRRDIDLKYIRNSKEYRRIIDLGFKDVTSHQQDLNNTIKLTRRIKKQSERGHDDVFYTIHPSGTVRRYNPPKSEEIPSGSGNDIKKFESPFRGSRGYLKAFRYLYNYLTRKEEKGNFR